MVSRSNLLQALAKLGPEAGDTPASDAAIRNQILAEMCTLVWMPSASVNPVVRFGVVDLHGFVFDERERAALKVLVENVPGVSAVRDRLVLIQPYPVTIPSADAERRAVRDAALGVL
jgi:osmotically-inducible protein OsmY